MTRTRILRMLAAAVLAACMALAPLSASAGPVASAERPLVKLTAQQVRAKGVRGIRALDYPEEAVIARIKGHVGHDGGMYEDASLYALAFMDFSEYDEGWLAVSFSEVATDGTYVLDLPEATDYRVGIYDGACVYEDAYYDGASTVESGTSVPVSEDTTVAGIDVTLTPRPENMISGTVSFSGAAAPSGDLEEYDFVAAAAMQYNSDWEEWESVSYGRVGADGTYRVHLPATGPYRLGFFDNSGAFSDVYYHDAPSAEEATDVVVPSPAESKTGIDQTMTAIPSQRVCGEDEYADRYGTAAAASQYAFEDGDVGRVILATGENWPDAISGSVLASRSYGPLLLTKKTTLPASTAEEIARLRPFEVVIVGGLDSVSLDVEIALRTEFDIPFVWRIAGRDRYETAALVAEQTSRDTMGVGALESEFETPPIVVASGEKFPDAMSAAPLAANAGSPVLLVKRDRVPASVQSFLDRHEDEFDSSLVIGSSSSISTPTAGAFPGWKRLAGADRYATAVKVADYGIDHFDMDATAVGIASGRNFPDGLAAVPVLAISGRPLLFTTPTALSPVTKQFIVDNGTSRAIVFGGEASVSSETFEQILGALGY